MSFGQLADHALGRMAGGPGDCVRRFPGIIGKLWMSISLT
jgi:hypothetical protein